MKKLIVILFLIPFICKANDTIYVKNVFINNFSVRVKSGYIIHKRKNTWIVNGKKYHIGVYKETDDKEYKRILTPKK